MTGKVRTFHRRRLSREEGIQYAERVLATPAGERLADPRAMHLDDPEMLLSLLGMLPKMCESAPARALEEAAFLYDYLQGLEVRYPTDPILYDEREYFMGESARLAGTACRFLSRREEARHWFDRSEAWFLATENSAANIARLGYQRLALRTDEHGDLSSVLDLLPRLIGNFDRMAMQEDALKARFLEATVLKEMGKLREAIEPFQKVIADAQAIRNEHLLAAAYVNVAQIHCFLGENKEATAVAEKATPLLQRIGHQVALAKLQWGIGYLLREKGDLAASIAAFREAQRSFAAIAMQGDVAAVHLVLADLLLDAGQASQAEWEIRAALPIIEEYRLVPESIAAFSLLRESIKRRQIDRHALRELHGYFRDQQSQK
jgi:tetratricopeptide (TPR) repeat protein